MKKIRIKLKAYDNKLLDSTVADIVNVAKEKGAEVIGPIPLPTKINKYTILRSVFVNIKSREQFEIRTHKRLIDIVITSQTADIFENIDISAGVEIEVKSL
ncbi:30S ribosomal protein S10 [bacterium]|nr:30S ribosomal protein S10 [bacterium]